MNENLRKSLIAALCLALAAAAAWLWFDNLELRPSARLKISDAMRDNPMLGATLLLRQHGHDVDVADTLADLPLQKLAGGTLLATNSSGIVTSMQARQLLAWVALGNTLIMQPHWLKKGEGEAGAKSKQPTKADAATLAELTETDPIGTRLGVRLGPGRRQKTRCDSSTAAEVKDEGKNKLLFSQHFVCLEVPGKPYPLELDIGAADALVSLSGGTAPVWSDAGGEAVRVYAEGRGHIVMLATDYFDHGRLPRYDHAELLLALAGLNAGARQVFIVQQFDAMPWYRALWNNFKPVLVSLAFGLLLLFWAAVRRFGPLIPEPLAGRRALMEHIDASGHWLWKLPAGRKILLMAARNAVGAILVRRAPELHAMEPQQQARLLARLSGLPEAELQAALFQTASSQPETFTRQIRTLQKLRHHYER